MTEKDAIIAELSDQVLLLTQDKINLGATIRILKSRIEDLEREKDNSNGDAPT